MMNKTRQSLAVTQYRLVPFLFRPLLQTELHRNPFSFPLIDSVLTQVLTTYILLKYSTHSVKIASNFKPPTVRRRARWSQASKQINLNYLYNNQPDALIFTNLFLEWNYTCFGQFLCPSSGVIHCTLSNGICHTGLQTAFEQQQDGTAVPSWSCSCSKTVCMTYTIAECTVNNSWWCTEEMSETCRVSFQK
jgi:hypothetical protein